MKGDRPAAAPVRAILDQIQETEARFRVMADCAPVLLWMSGPDGDCHFFNQTWLDFTGRTMAEEVGIGWTEGVHFEDFQRCVDVYVEAFNARRSFEMEYRLRRRDGEYRWVLDRGVPRFLSDGTFMGFIGSCIDITERKLAEEERRSLVTSLSESVRLREQFISIASHELNTPLTSLGLQLDRLLRMLSKQKDELDPGLLARLRRPVESARHDADRLGTLVQHMLDIARVPQIRRLLSLSEVDLAGLAESVVGRLEGDLVAARCPAETIAEGPVIGRWDAFRVEQILVNLLSNAMKYAPGGPVRIEVSSAGDAAMLVVRDQGPGIAPEDHERIFACFERVASPEQASGLGLGLYLSREIALAHGGKLRVESEPGKGASFHVELPLAGPPPSR